MNATKQLTEEQRKEIDEFNFDKSPKMLYLREKFTNFFKFLDGIYRKSPLYANEGLKELFERELNSFRETVLGDAYAMFFIIKNKYMTHYDAETECVDIQKVKAEFKALLKEVVGYEGELDFIAPEELEKLTAYYNCFCEAYLSN